MTDETNEFLAEGMKRYKQAARIMVSFGKEVESSLRSILEERKDWGKIKGKLNPRAKSTSFWSEYPLLNAKLEGTFEEENVTVVIAVNWYGSHSEYPFYCVWLEPSDRCLARLEQFDWGSDFEFREKSLRFYVSPDDFDLVRDFNRLLDEFVRFLAE